MLLSRTEALRDAAAAATLKAIRQDRARVPRELKPLLAYIEEHLFDESFKVAKMKRACNVRDNSVVTRFKRELNLRPTDYVKKRRLQVGKELLESTELEVWMIAELVGFSSQQLFSRNFGERFGLSPRAHRRQHAEARSVPAEPSFTTRELRRALETGLDRRRTDALVRRLWAHHPEVDGSREPAFFDPQRFWEEIRDLSPEDQGATIREGFAGAGRALFELLCDKSREEGRLDRQRGVQLMELARESLETCAPALGEELQDLRALGWARLANSRRLALDFPGAEEAFRHSESEWRVQRGNPDQQIEAEILFLKAAFRNIQHRFGEAMELSNQALELLGRGDKSRLHAKILILRASITGIEGDLEASIADLIRARALVDPHDRRLRLSICHNLAAAQTDAGLYQEAAETLPVARQLCTETDELLVQHQLQWLEGRILQGLEQEAAAEERFLASHAGFSQCGQSGHAAVVAIDLALICCEQQRSEALSFAAEAIPVLDAFKIRSEALAARRLLAREVERKQLSTKVLCQVRSVLGELLKDPSVRLPRAG